MSLYVNLYIEILLRLTENTRQNCLITIRTVMNFQINSRENNSKDNRLHRM